MKYTPLVIALNSDINNLKMWWGTCRVSGYLHVHVSSSFCCFNTSVTFLSPLYLPLPYLFFSLLSISIISVLSYAPYLFLLLSITPTTVHSCHFCLWCLSPSSRVHLKMVRSALLGGRWDGVTTPPNLQEAGKSHVLFMLLTHYCYNHIIFNGLNNAYMYMLKIVQKLWEAR